MNIRFTPNRDAIPRLRTAADALRLRTADMKGPVLRRLGQVHRRQQKAIFTSEGGAGGRGKWTPLSPPYKAKKNKHFPGKKILQLSGEMKDRFTRPTHPAYVQRYVPLSARRGKFQFGARDSVAAAHRAGNPGLSGPPVLASRRAAASRRIFGGVARHLPVRDVAAKSRAQVEEIRQAFKTWYLTERWPQVKRALQRGAR